MIARGLVALGLSLVANIASAQTLDDLLKQARSNAPEVLQYDAQQLAAEANVKAIDGAFDWYAYANASWYQDASEKSSVLAGERTDQLAATVGIRRLLPSATALDISFKHQRDFTEYGAAVGGFDPSLFTAFNPGYTSSLGVSVSQPLWRNWLGREIDLQRQLLEVAGTQSNLQAKLVLQVVQAGVESLYWQLAALQARIGLTERLLGKTRRFAQLMAERERVGRSEAVDVADAESTVVAQEGALLNLRVTYQQLQQALTDRVTPGGAPLVLAPIDLRQAPLALETKTIEDAMKLARQQRIDIQLLDVARQPYHVQRALYDEQRKPSLAIAGSLRTSGLEDSFGSSFADTLNDADSLTYSIGLQAEINLSQREISSRLDAVEANLVALDGQLSVIENDTRTEIRGALIELDAGRQLEAQANTHIRSLERLRRLEVKKFQQARSEEIAVLRYEMEVIAAEADRIGALQKQRMAEARIRLATHDYAVEVGQ